MRYKRNLAQWKKKKKKNGIGAHKKKEMFDLENTRSVIIIKKILERKTTKTNITWV